MINKAAGISPPPPDGARQRSSSNSSSGLRRWSGFRLPSTYGRRFDFPACSWGSWPAGKVKAAAAVVAAAASMRKLYQKRTQTPKKEKKHQIVPVLLLLPPSLFSHPHSPQTEASNTHPDLTPQQKPLRYSSRTDVHIELFSRLLFVSLFAAAAVATTAAAAVSLFASAAFSVSLFLFFVCLQFLKQVDEKKKASISARHICVAHCTL